MTEQEARAEQGYTEVDPFDLSDDQSDEVTALAEATVGRDALARAYDPDAFTDRALDQTRHVGAVIQWAARRHLAVEAADRVIASGILAERSRVVAAPSDTDRKMGIAEFGAAVTAAFAQSSTSQPVQVEVTTEMVERAAKALHVDSMGVGDSTWEDSTEEHRSMVRWDARTALFAALGGGE